MSAIAVRSGQSEEAVLDEIIKAQSFAELMEPADVAAAYLFLASDAAMNITGQAINVDRGEIMS